MDLFDDEMLGTDYAVLNQMWERMEQENPEQTLLGTRMRTEPASPSLVSLVPGVIVSEGNSLALSSHFSTATLKLD